MWAFFRRAKVGNYAPQLSGNTAIQLKSVPPGQLDADFVGCPGSIWVHMGKKSYFHSLEGVVTRTNLRLPGAEQCVAYSTPVLPAGCIQGALASMRSTPPIVSALLSEALTCLNYFAIVRARALQHCARKLRPKPFVPAWVIGEGPPEILTATHNRRTL